PDHGRQGRAQALALVSAEAPREPDRPAGHQAKGSARVQPTYDPSLSAEGRIPVLLGVRLAGLGREVHGSVVQEGHAIADRANEEDRPDAPDPQAAHSQLVRGARATLARGCRGAQQQIESEYQKILRLPDVKSDQS